MIQLTPLEETTAGRELLELGEQRGEQRGELIGTIRMCQKLLGLKIDTRQKLSRKSLETLQKQATELEAQVMARR